MAAALARLLGNASAVVMRANGAVTVGSSIEHAMAHAWCLEDAARIEHSVRSMTTDPEDSLLTPDEIKARQVSSGRVFERLWEFMTDGDPEAPDVNEVFKIT